MALFRFFTIYHVVFLLLGRRGFAQSTRTQHNYFFKLTTFHLNDNETPIDQAMYGRFSRFALLEWIETVRSWQDGHCIYRQPASWPFDSSNAPDPELQSCSQFTHGTMEIGLQNFHDPVSCLNI